MKAKLLLIFFISLHTLLSFGQSFIGKWVHFNNEKESVTIELGRKSEYIISNPNRHLSPTEDLDDMKLPTELKYDINLNTSPAEINIRSEISGNTIHGIIEFIGNGTIQIQINPVPNGIRPAKFDPSSVNYVRCKRLPNDSISDDI